MNYTLLLHNILRWAVLLLGIWVVISAASAILSKNEYKKSDNKISLFFMINDYILISTSTPEGNSNFISASTVLEEEE